MYNYHLIYDEENELIFVSEQDWDSFTIFCIDDISLVSRYLDEQEGFNNVSLGTWMNWKDMIINYVSLGTWMKRKDIIINYIYLDTWMNRKDMIINYISLGTRMKRKDIIINFISLGTWTSRKGRKGLFLSGFFPAWIQPYQSSSFINMPQVVSVSEGGGVVKAPPLLSSPCVHCTLIIIIISRIEDY